LKRIVSMESMNMNKVMLLIDFMGIGDDFIFHLEDKYKCVIEIGELVDALDKEGIEPPLNENIIHNFISSSSYLDTCTPILERIVLLDEDGVLPGGIENELTKKKYKIKGEVWDVHQDDVDPFPSSPHAHNYDENVVMHLGTGELYRSRKLVGKVSKKHFLRLRALINNVELPTLEI
ncbi:hypothetical protein DDN22_18760, partial [Vibrio cholerae]|nr:hypothetical protein [Vibrio cholerae]